MKVKEMIEGYRKNNPAFEENISQILVPTEKVYTTRAGKKVLKEKVMFSGYVFVKLHLTPDIEVTLQDTTNVVNFVRSREGDRRPEPVPEHQILTMLGQAEAREMEAVDSMNDFVVGESVKVNFGPFSGFIGEIKEVNREKRELTVMVKVFGRETPLKLDNSQVERE
jgi:transcriptional antiterminator NusG